MSTAVGSRWETSLYLSRLDRWRTVCGVLEKEVSILRLLEGS